MSINIYKPFTALGTRLRSSFSEDPFVRTRIWTTILYFGFAFVTLVVVGLFVDQAAADVVEEMLTHPELTSAAEVTRRLEEIRWAARIFNIIVFAVWGYILLGVTLRPLKESVEMQKRFIANISHELRTPLTVARAETELALRNKESLTLADATEVLENNLSHIDHVSRIVQFFLVISDFGAGRARALNRELALDDVVAAVLERLKQSAEGKGVSLISELAAEHAVLRGNSTALEEMVLNLVKNAITYTPPGGIVTVRISQENGPLLLSVSDTGTGIPEKDMARIFEPFYRAGNAKPGGTGLGLSIVRAVAKLHKASLDIQSTLGVGTEVRVLFRG